MHYYDPLNPADSTRTYELCFALGSQVSTKGQMELIAPLTKIYRQRKRKKEKKRMKKTHLTAQAAYPHIPVQFCLISQIGFYFWRHVVPPRQMYISLETYSDFLLNVGPLRESGT